MVVSLVPFLASAETSQCARELLDVVNSDLINEFERETGFDLTRLTTEASLETLFYRGLPFLKNLAEQNGMSIARLLEDQHALFRLIVEDDAEASPAAQREHLEFLAQLHEAFDGIERLLERKRPTEAMEAQLLQAELFLRVVSFGFAMSQLEHAPLTTINPFAAFDEERLEQLLSEIENGAFERVLDTFARRSTPAALPFPSSSDSVPITPVDRESTRPPPSPTCAPSVLSTNLAVALKGAEPLDAETTYTADTQRGPTYRVHFSTALIKAMEGRYGEKAHRLVRSIFTNRGGDSGIKFIDVGPNIIELKTVMNGHFRIIGCLEGADLRLLTLMNIKETVRTYARRIPKNLCAEAPANKVKMDSAPRPKRARRG